MTAPDPLPIEVQPVPYPCCKHCDHEAPWGGSETLTADGAGHTMPCANCGSAGVTAAAAAVPFGSESEPGATS
jgi:hypothetical protein